MFERIKNFSTLLGFSALFIAGCAAFYSVFGLSKLFAGSAVAVIFMASSLELGKLVAASFLYRFWDDINLAIKTYLIIGVITLVLITSAGIFGFLSNAYQGATVQFEKQSNELLALEDRLEQLEDDRTFLKDEFEQSVNDLPENYITAKRKLREQFNPQIQKLNEQILNVKSRKSDLEISLIETGVDVGPAIYLARVFDTDIDSVVKFFIFILIFVFDPMAVCLIIAYNKSLEQNKTGVEKIFDKYKSKTKVIKSKKKTVPNKKKEIVIKEVDENNEKNLSSPKGGIKPSS